MKITLRILPGLFFVFLFGSDDFQVQGLRVTGKDSTTETNAGNDVTIPCKLSDVSTPLDLQRVSVHWSHRLHDGTERDVYRLLESNHKSLRSGCYMNDSKVVHGDASLYISGVQISDEGEYTCYVIVSPNDGRATSTLQVSVTPQIDVRNSTRTEHGCEGGVTCEVRRFYPKDIGIQWVRHIKNTGTNSTLQEGVYFTDPVQNDDGTFNMSSLITVRSFHGAEPGDVFSCAVSHRSSKEKIVSSYTMPIEPQIDERGIEFGYETGVKCEIRRVYPKDIRIQWVRHHKSNGTNSTLQEDIYFTDPVQNDDGTFNMSSLMSMRYLQAEPGDEYFCVVTHRSNKEKIVATYTIPRESSWMNVMPTFLVVFVPMLLIWCYCKGGKPTVSKPCGDEHLLHGKSSTLTFQITDFRVKEIQIDVSLKRWNEKRKLISSWKSSGSTSSKNSDGLQSSAAERQNTHNALLMLNDDPSFPEGMKVEQTRSCFGMYTCHGSITLIPNADRDDGAVLTVEVIHSTLIWPICLRRTLRVQREYPIVSPITGDMWIPQMKETTLTCQVKQFIQKKMQINVYLKRRHDLQKHLIHSSVSVEYSFGEDITARHRGDDTCVVEQTLEGVVHETSIPVRVEAEIIRRNGEYTCDCIIHLTPNADTDDCAVLVVEVHHAALEYPIWKHHTLHVFKGDNPSLWKRLFYSSKKKVTFFCIKLHEGILDTLQAIM